MNFELGNRAMSSLNEMNQALRRQTSSGLPHPTPAANVNHPRVGLVKTLVRAIKRRHTASLLKGLDSHLLDDIGITRGEIDAIAAKAATAAVLRQGTPAMPGTAWLAKLPAEVLTVLTKAWRRQAAISALRRLSNHTLADIGIERGRIVESVDAMLARNETAPASDRASVTAKAATAKPVDVGVPGHKLAA